MAFDTLKPIFNENYDIQLVEGISQDTDHYDISGARVLKLGRDILSAILNYYNLSSTFKKDIAIEVKLPEVEINFQKYFIIQIDGIYALINSKVLEKDIQDSDYLTIGKIFGDSLMLNKQDNYIAIDTNNFSKEDYFIFFCNSNQLDKFYNLKIPESGITIILNNKNNSDDIISISSISSLLHIKDIYLKVSPKIAKSIIHFSITQKVDKSNGNINSLYHQFIIFLKIVLHQKCLYLSLINLSEK